MTVTAPPREKTQERSIPASEPSAVAPAPSVRWFFLLLGAITVARMILMARMPLTGDEAYYWQWSRHLAGGYYDHPPMIAWTIALMNALFGHTVFATRLAGPLFMMITSLFLYFTGRDLSKSPQVGALGATLFIIAPLPAIGGMAVVPDAPVMAFWSVCLYFLQRAIFADDDRSWTWGGIALGLAMMSKLMAFFLMPSLFVFLFLSNEHRYRLRSFGPYRFVLTGFVVASPFLYWNATHHWVTFLYQATSRLELPPSYHYFIDFLAYEAAALSPILFFLAVYVFVTALRRRDDSRMLFLWSFCACILLSFISVSFRTRIGGHWPFPGYISLMAAMALTWQTAGRTYRRWFGAAIGLAGAVTLFVYLLLVNPDLVFRWMSSRTIETHGINKGQKVTSNDLAEIYGYEELSAHLSDIDKTMAAEHPTFVFTDSYTLSSIIAFYSGLDTHVARGSLLGREYRRWDHFDDLIGQNAIFVDLAPLGARPDIQFLLTNAFERVEPEAPMQVYKDGQPVRQFFIIRCYNFKQNIFQPTGGMQQ